MQERLITVFPARTRVDLSGLWDFLPLAKPTARPPRPAAYHEKLAVPGVWECAFRHFSHRGFGWYRRMFQFPPGTTGAVRLHFGAVSHTVDVWVDGKQVGRHTGAHTAFDVVLPHLAAGPHELCLQIGNTFGPHNPLIVEHQDIHLYGGPTRALYAEVLPDVRIARASAIPTREGHRWWLDVSVTLDRSGAATKGPAEITITLDDRTLGRVPVGRNGRGSARLAAGPVELWSPDRPRLYTVRLAADDDVWQERIGFRTIATRGRQLLLNGEPLILKGVNRHEFHPDFGPALPLAVHLRDIEILKELGANFVRGSHYPNDPLFLDLCDESGILFWEELSHWGTRLDVMRTPEFMKQSLAQLDEMVEQHRHHPSIVLWGMLNEADTDKPAARRIVKTFVDRFHALDATRPVTFASNRLEKDCCLDLVDVVALNTYPGWYSGDLPDCEALTRDRVDLLVRRSGNKPLILSEFGAAALSGVRSLEMRKWTENFQAELLRRVIGVAQNSRTISGVALWQFCDVRTSRAIWNSRAREYNNKGILSERREPKLGFYAVKEAFSKPWKPVRQSTP